MEILETIKAIQENDGTVTLQTETIFVGQDGKDYEAKAELTIEKNSFYVSKYQYLKTDTWNDVEGERDWPEDQICDEFYSEINEAFEEIKNR